MPNTYGQNPFGGGPKPYGAPQRFDYRQPRPPQVGGGVQKPYGPPPATPTVPQRLDYRKPQQPPTGNGQIFSPMGGGGQVPQPFPTTPFPGMGQGYGQQQGFPSGQMTSNPFMPQFQQPRPQPQQMPLNPQNPYQNSWDWNQNGRFPGFRSPIY